jgi:S-adenosyl methyltransferase
MTDMSERPWAFDTSIPNVARMYNCWLGGKDNFAADREAAERSAAAVPQLPRLARENRKFLSRAVRYLAADAGITQFLDIGSGLPADVNVHEVAARATDAARVVYVDHDPVVVSHARALLAGERTHAFKGDLTRPDEIVDAVRAAQLLDFGQPVALLLLAVLHFISDADNPVALVARLREVLAPGSYLAISHAHVLPGQVRPNRQGHDRLATTAARELNRAFRGVPRGGGYRTREDIAAFFGDFTMVDPGLTEIWAWRPDASPVRIAADVMTVYGGVARKD